jgi:hypothetical protein
MSDCPNDPANGYGSHNTTHPLPCPCCDAAAPFVWVRPNGSNSIGVAHYGPTCPPGWAGAAEPAFRQAAIDAAVAAERERCAELCQSLAGGGWIDAAQTCANAIRDLGPNYRLSGAPHK